MTTELNLCGGSGDLSPGRGSGSSEGQPSPYMRGSAEADKQNRNLQGLVRGGAVHGKASFL